VTRDRRPILLIILAVALAVRLAHWAAVRGEPFFAQLAMDSQEYDRWAQAIAGGDWLGSQVFFQAPLYPYLLAMVYTVFGRSLDAVYLLQIAAAVAGVWALWRAGRSLGDERAGLVAAALAAVYGPFLFYDVQILKESLAITVTCFLLWALAAAWKEDGAGRWLTVGVLLGILALLRENALLLLPFLLPLAWRRGTRVIGMRGFARRGGLLVLGLALPLAPVALRNGLVGGDFLPTTFNAGVSFWIGNNPQADGTYRPIVPGKQVPTLERKEPVRLAEQALGRRLTPAEISSFWLRRSLAWAAAHPGDFVRLQIRKLGMFWSWYEWPDAVDPSWVRTLSPVLRLPLVEFGTVSLLAPVGLWLLWRRKRLADFAPAWLFALGWMLSTVVFFLFSRYRLPVVPALLLFSGVVMVELNDVWRERRRGWLAAASLAMAAFVLPDVIRFEPRMDLVHYNLGRLADERGDDVAAEEHYHAAFVLNPHDFLACLNLGNHAARRQDWATALRFYQRAAALEPGSDDAESNLGGVYLAAGDFPAAEQHLDRALTLNPQSLSALQNGALLRLRESDTAGARELVRRMLEIDPQNPAALRLRDRLAG
jgi:Tfp pilus assembly protein PilF